MNGPTTAVAEQGTAPYRSASWAAILGRPTSDGPRREQLRWILHAYRHGHHHTAVAVHRLEPTHWLGSVRLWARGAGLCQAASAKNIFYNILAVHRLPGSRGGTATDRDPWNLRQQYRPQGQLY